MGCLAVPERGSEVRRLLDRDERCPVQSHARNAQRPGLSAIWDTASQSVLNCCRARTGEHWTVLEPKHRQARPAVDSRMPRTYSDSSTNRAKAAPVTPSRLSQAQIDDFQRDGFLAPVDALSRAEARALRDELEAFERT